MVKTLPQTKIPAVYIGLFSPPDPTSGLSKRGRLKRPIRSTPRHSRTLTPSFCQEEEVPTTSAE